MIRRLVVRGAIIFLVIILGLVVLASFYPQYVTDGLYRMVKVWPVVAAASPDIDAPRGDLPAGPVGLQQWLREPGLDPVMVETCGFLLRLDQGEIVGVTTAHGLFLGNSNWPLERVGLGVNGQSAPAAEADAYYGLPGVPFAGTDTTVDYVFLKVEAAGIDPALVLEPDPRELPKKGERVVLFSGFGDRHGGAVPWEGTIIADDPKMVMIWMDEAALHPGGMSGSPVLSQYTGRVVGMAMGATQRSGRWLIAIHPIGHLVQVAEEAREFPKIVDYQR